MFSPSTPASAWSRCSAEATQCRRRLGAAVVLGLAGPGGAVALGAAKPARGLPGPMLLRGRGSRLSAPRLRWGGCLAQHTPVCWVERRVGSALGACGCAAVQPACCLPRLARGAMLGAVRWPLAFRRFGARTPEPTLASGVLGALVVSRTLGCAGTARCRRWPSVSAARVSLNACAPRSIASQAGRVVNGEGSLALTIGSRGWDALGSQCARSAACWRGPPSGCARVAQAR